MVGWLSLPRALPAPAGLSPDPSRESLRAAVVTAVPPGAAEVSPFLPVRSLSLAARCAAPLLFALAACQEPTGVGIGLIDDEASAPNATPVEATSLALRSASTTTAGFAENGSPAQSRVLVGSVLDPVYGDASAVAYLDANLPTAGRPQNFQDSTITAVALRLRLDTYATVDDDTLFYVYGDPSAALPIEVRQVTASWSPIDLDVDATLATGAVIATGTILPTDTTYTIDLDPAWVAANAATIRSEQFLTEFEGLEVRVPEGSLPGVVRGFSAAASDLLVATAGDTLSFPINEVLTSLQQGAPSASESVLALRGGRAEALAFDADFGPIGARPLARAQLRFPLDRSQTGGTTFVRPLARRALLVGVSQDTLRSVLANIDVLGDGEAGTFVRAAANQGLQVGFTSVIQDVLIGSRAFDRYEVLLRSDITSANPVSLDVLPVVIAPPTSGMKAPRFVLTLIGNPEDPA